MPGREHPVAKHDAAFPRIFTGQDAWREEKRAGRTRTYLKCMNVSRRKIECRRRRLRVRNGKRESYSRLGARPAYLPRNLSVADNRI